ncbi:MAG: DUF1801 domain-containing protein [Chitinophagaceae bacterium]|nr:DUF1801 domain-containing protein [Chitinophagaceae bacterium]
MTKESLQTIFDAIKTMMKKYEKGSVVPTADSSSKYELYSQKNAEIMGKVRDSIYFATVAIKSDYVGFYFFPIYVFPDKTKTYIQPELLKTLKGKTCFHIKKNDKEQMSQIKEALLQGYNGYKEKGWV